MLKIDKEREEMVRRPSSTTRNKRHTHLHTYTHTYNITTYRKVLALKVCIFDVHAAGDDLDAASVEGGSSALLDLLLMCVCM